MTKKEFQLKKSKLEKVMENMYKADLITKEELKEGIDKLNSLKIPGQRFEVNIIFNFSLTYNNIDYTLKI